MKQMLTRKEFIKSASTLALAPALHRFPGKLSGESERPNIIMIIFDAMAARNLSLYGYPRRTSPNLERFAQRATVYHNHHSAGNFTTPSTASLFTSTHPWTHRAFNLESLVHPDVEPQSIFNLLKETHSQLAFSQNVLADTLISQSHRSIDQHASLDSFTTAGHTFYSHLFNNDPIAGIKSYDQFLYKREAAHGSLLLSILNDLNTLIRYEIHSKRLAEIYPYGLPRLANTDVYYVLEQIMEGLAQLLTQAPQPFFSYNHLMPPHEPYMPTSQFLGTFNDGWAPPKLKKHRLAPGVTQERLDERRQTYDEFIANLDDEFGRLLDTLESQGLLETSYLMVTSDHGEFFEKGVHGHSTPLLFEPVINIPLIISAPGQRERVDIHSLTSNVDIAPTLLHIAGLPIPQSYAGLPLPGLGGQDDPDRSIWVMDALKNSTYEPLHKATIALIKGPYKLIRYMGYLHYKDAYELYDLENDPSEINNLYPDHPISGEMQSELDQKFEEINRPYA